MSTDINVCMGFLKKNAFGQYSGALYHVDSYSAQSVRELSQYPSEDEAILLPATKLRVIKRTKHKLHPNVYEVFMAEIAVARKSNPFSMTTRSNTSCLFSDILCISGTLLISKFLISEALISHTISSDTLSSGTLLTSEALITEALISDTISSDTLSSGTLLTSEALITEALISDTLLITEVFISDTFMGGALINDTRTSSNTSW